MLKNKKIAFIGGGNMAEAIIAGLIGKKTIDPKSITVSEKQEERKSYLKKRFSLDCINDNRRAVEQSDITILAVKPQVFDQAAEEIGKVRSDKLIISILAGTKAEKIQNALGNPRVVRVMPNTPALVGEGMAGISGSKTSTEDDIKITEYIFNQLGKSITVKESMLDLITGVSGSGPAYVFYLVESLCDAAVSMGLDKEKARLLVNQTFAGSIKLLVESGEDPAELRHKVTSKGGTTEQGILVMESNNIKKIIADTVKAATEKSRELSKNV